ncbi:class I SAM-dependent methyltransferase [Flavisolibacter nicotianae]|uniref:class I SAM-dependent methyltransferase n=1 Tax=Flavisolibacter nicotianae TaxID=2364882 RepID=UPI000EAC0644|nr:class I SAM-dependent methyltransferase [Flavisolibacter nicotianae]
MSAITTFTGSIPYHYETFLGPLFFEPYALDLAERIHANDRARILKLACGTGRVTRQLVGKLPQDSRLQATDLNADMLRIAKEQVNDPRVEWSVADAQDLPFEREQFDLVICQFGVMFFEDKRKAFAEVFRVLKPGGSFLFNTWDAVPHNAVASLTEQALQKVFPKDPPTFFMKGPHSFFDQSLIRQLLEGSGFRRVKIEPVDKTSVAATPDDVVRGILDGTPISPFLKEREEQANEVRKQLRELLVRDYGNRNLALPMRAFVCDAARP